MTTNGLYVAIEKKGYRPATFRELLEMGAYEPNLQKRHTIIALGTSVLVLGRQRVAGLGYYVGERLLMAFVAEPADVWDPFYRFAVVRITPSP